ncbi:MAG TPA: hypothetical protein DD490_22860, partial [Acidobacteria bacterium]|nr:hypothetical protein [Acidobacteriota bacterium]
MAPTFDVFLSHNSKDRTLVRQIKARLQAYGLHPWLDADELRPGLPFQDGLEAAMQTTGAAAVFVGPHGFGNWQKPEIRAFLNQLFNEGKPVIPVLLPGAPDKPDLGLFLRENTWVDLRAGLSDEGIERLVWGITGTKPVRPKRRQPAARAATVEGAPERSRHFQDRSAEVAACLAALRTSRLVTLLGLPGAGKSEVSLAVAEAVLQDRTLRPARALWLPLAGVRRVDEITGRLALAFAAGDAERLDSLAAVIGDQSVLLVLDNAEDLIGPARLAFQTFCGELLRLCRGIRLLLTSRRRLGDVNGCTEVEVQIGRLPPPLDLHLFRSAAVGRLSPQELASPELPALVEALDGHPLSLVLVAGQAGRGLSLATLRRQLDREGDAAILADELLGDPDVASTPDEELRTKRLISSLNLSVSPLVEKHPATAEVFFWLGHFPAGLLADLVPALFGEEGATHQRLLLGHNLVELVRNPEARLVLPAPVRWYARRRIADMPIDRRKALLTATLGGLGAALQAASDRSVGEHAPASLGLALREEPNLAALLPEAARHATSAGEALAAATSRALVPWLYLMSRAGRPAAALGLGEPAARAILSSAPGTAAEANTRQALGDLYVRTDRLREAEDAYQNALPIYQQIEARLGEANTRQALGDLYVRTDR